MATKGQTDHQFLVDLTGLNLDEAHRQRIATAVQRAVMDELASVDLTSKNGGLLCGFRRPPICGIVYIPNIPEGILGDF
jgi:hypothetical protein